MPRRAHSRRHGEVGPKAHEADGRVGRGLARLRPPPARRRPRLRVVLSDVVDLDTVLTSLRGGALPPVSAYLFMSTTSTIQSSSSSLRRPAQWQPARARPRACFLSADRFDRVRYHSELRRQAWLFHSGGSPSGATRMQESHPHLLTGAEEYLIRQRLRAVPLVADNVALPGGSAPPVDILPLLLPRLRERYSRLENVADLARLPPAPRHMRLRHPRVGRCAGLSFAFNISVSFLVVSPSINPADGPSRGQLIQPIL